MPLTTSSSPVILRVGHQLGRCESVGEAKNTGIRHQTFTCNDVGRVIFPVPMLFLRRWSSSPLRVNLAAANHFFSLSAHWACKPVLIGHSLPAFYARLVLNAGIAS